MQLLTAPWYFQHNFVTETEADWRNIKVSTSYPDKTYYTTIPWNVYTHPAGESSDLYQQPNTINGWTFLYGPCVFDVKAQIQFYEGQPDASGHALLYRSPAATDAIVQQYDNWEWEVLAKETHSSHLMGAWTGILPLGHRLRLAADYWHATAPAKIFKANVQGLYWRF